MVETRKPFQGVRNIIQFNAHFYIMGAISIIILFFIKSFIPSSLVTLYYFGLALALYFVVGSLLVSCYIYDYSDMYELPWLNDLDTSEVLNIHAGFDETSSIILKKFPNIKLINADFYDPALHTELSIKRARKMYPTDSGCLSISSEALPFSNKQFDAIIGTLSIHEIRKEEERIQFFKELHRILHSNGKVYLTEHLQDIPNFLANNIGFFHFHSKKTWKNTFIKSGFHISKIVHSTPFVQTFILTKHGTKS